MPKSYQPKQQQPNGEPRLPTDTEAEEWVIGSVLLEPATAADVFATVKPADFIDELCRAAIDAVHGAWQAGEPFDELLVLRAIRERGDLCGDQAAVFLATTAAAIPTAAHAKYYARRVAEAAKKRQLLSLSIELATAANDQAPAAVAVEQVLQKANEMIEIDVGNASPWARWKQSLNERDRRSHFDHAPVNSQLQRITIGPGLLTLIGGKPGAGKTALAMQMAVNAAFFDESLRVLVANCEMDPGTLLDRTVARISRVPYGVVRDRTFAGDRNEKVMKSAGQLMQLEERMTFVGPPFTMARVRALAASTKADLVVIDYMQRFECGDDAADQRLQVSRAMSAVRELAMSGPAVLLVSALSRAGEFRESSELEYGADQAWVLERDGERRSRRDGAAGGEVPQKSPRRNCRCGAQFWRPLPRAPCPAGSGTVWRICRLRRDRR